MNKQELKEIKINLLKGVKYTGIKNGYSQGVIYLEDNKIYYENFGSSCVKNTIKDLKWLLNVIFKECDLITECIYSEYHLNYKPISSEYKCIDMSRSHPNINGL